MSHFYGSVQGGRGQANRCGHKSTGLTTHAKTWHASVTTKLWHHNGEDFAEVSLSCADGTSRLLFFGKLDSCEPPKDEMPIDGKFTLDELAEAKAMIEGVARREVS